LDETVTIIITTIIAIFTFPIYTYLGSSLLLTQTHSATMSEQNDYKVDEDRVAIYNHLDEQMMSLHDLDTDESRAESESIARRLIVYADLPLIIRVHAHMILASGDRAYVWHAQEAVRVVKHGIEQFGSNEATASVLAEAERLLRIAIRDQEIFEELKTRVMDELGAELTDQPEPGEDLEYINYGFGWSYQG
jgi:hypothetical protein